MSKTVKILATVTSVIIVVSMFNGCSRMFNTITTPLSTNTTSQLAEGNGSVERNKTTVKDSDSPSKHKTEVKTPDSTPTPATTPSPAPSTQAVQPSNVVVPLYYYSTLNDTEKKVYDQLVQAAKSWEASVVITPISSQSLATVWSSFLTDNPALFYVKPDCQYHYAKDTGLVHDVQITYTVDKNTAQDMTNNINNVVNPLVDRINAESQGDAYMKVQLAHDWLVNNDEYLNDWNSDGAQDFQTIYGAFVTHKVSCMGYADGFLYLMQKLGIEAIAVKGQGVRPDGSKERHEWNMIKLNGEWYHTDVCWDDPIMNNDSMKLTGYSPHGYMNISESMILRDHTLNQAGAYLPNAPKASTVEISPVSYYARHGLVFDSSAQYQNYVDTHVQEFANTGNALEVQFTNDNAYNDAVTNLNTICTNAITSIAQEGGQYNCYWLYSPVPRTVTIQIVRQ